MDLSGVVIAEFSDVTRTKSPGLAGNHSAGHFPAREDGGGFEFNFGTSRGKFLKRDKRVCSVEAYADNVHLRCRAH
jgi:hypothetical protein